MQEFLVRSIHFDNQAIQRVISLLDYYMDIAIENEPDETEIENISDLILDICKQVYQRKYEKEI